MERSNEGKCFGKFFLCSQNAHTEWREKCSVPHSLYGHNDYNNHSHNHNTKILSWWRCTRRHLSDEDETGRVRHFVGRHQQADLLDVSTIVTRSRTILVHCDCDNLDGAVVFLSSDDKISTTLFASLQMARWWQCWLQCWSKPLPTSSTRLFILLNTFCVFLGSILSPRSTFDFKSSVSLVFLSFFFSFCASLRIQFSCLVGSASNLLECLRRRPRLTPIEACVCV